MGEVEGEMVGKKRMFSLRKDSWTCRERGLACGMDVAEKDWAPWCPGS